MFAPLRFDCNKHHTRVRNHQRKNKAELPWKRSVETLIGWGAWGVLQARNLTFNSDTKYFINLQINCVCLNIAIIHEF